MGEAIGSCNSWESKYRYRWVPEEIAKQRADFDSLLKRGGMTQKFEPNFALDKKETGGQYGKPITYWEMFEQVPSKRVGPSNVSRKMGKKEFDGWGDHDGSDSSTAFRIPRWRIPSTPVMKMAQKRSLVAAVLVVTRTAPGRASHQDIEDFHGDEHHEPTPAQPKIRA